MGTLSKLGIALTVVFTVFVAALVAQLIFVKWRQRRFRRRSLSAGDRESNYSTTTADAVANVYLPSKELLYFFCWKNQSSLQVEPNGRAIEARSGQTEPEEIDDILKWHGTMYGPPRFLFTISEDQEREVGSEPDGISTRAATAPPMEEMKSSRVCLKECLEAPEPEASEPEALPVEEPEAEVDDGVAMAVVSVEATPFSTPCASPPYFTPSPSPARDNHVAIDVEDTDDDFAVSECKAPQFVSLEISGT